MNAFSLRPRTGEISKLSQVLTVALETLARAIMQDEETKGIQIWKEETKWSLFADDTRVY